MRTSWQDPAVIDRLMRTARTVAVVGASSRPERPSHQIAWYLHRNGFTVIPVNPTLSTLFGLPAYPDLASVPEHIDVVDVFRASDAVLAVAEQAVAVGADALWLQLGIVNEPACELAANAGLAVVADRCMKVEHARVTQSS